MGKVNITTDDGPSLGTEAPLIADLPVGTFFRQEGAKDGAFWLRVRNDPKTSDPCAVDLKDGLMGRFGKHYRAIVVYKQVDVVATVYEALSWDEETIRLAKETV